MSLELLDHKRARLYVDLSDPLDVEGSIRDLTEARAAWVRREAEALRRAMAAEGERWACDETPRADLDAAIERRTVGADFEAERFAPESDGVQANDRSDDDA